MRTFDLVVGWVLAGLLLVGGVFFAPLVGRMPIGSADLPWPVLVLWAVPLVLAAVGASGLVVAGYRELRGQRS